MVIFTIIIKIFGSVGLFLYAMKLLSKSLQNSAGEKLEKILSAMTGNRFSAVFTGMITTAAVQSSTATTVMVVGFVNAGIFTLKQAVGVIMGANIGTTVTSWIVSTLGFSYDVMIISFIFLVVSFALSFVKKTNIQELSKLFVALALIFTSLNFLKNAFPDDILNNAETLSYLKFLKSGNIVSILLCMVIGMIVTVLLQSSAAAMTLTITASSLGLIGAFGACAMCLGQNIGTTFAAVIASSSSQVNAKRAASAHMIFNVAGSILVLMLLHPFMSLVNIFTARNIFTATGAELARELPIFLSMFHTAFNLFNTILFLPFIDQFVALIEKLIPDKENKTDEHYKFSFKFSLPFLSMPDVYLSVVKDEIIKLSQTVLEMLSDLSQVLNAQDEDRSEIIKRIEKNESKADEMQEELTAFCVKLISKKVSSYHTSTLTSFIRIIDELESITDSCYALSMDAQRRYENKLFFNDVSQRQILDYLDKVKAFMEFIDQNIRQGGNTGLVKSAFDFENSLNVGRAELVAMVEKRMESTQNIKTELIEFDMVRHMEHIGDYCTNIAQSIASSAKK